MVITIEGYLIFTVIDVDSVADYINRDGVFQPKDDEQNGQMVTELIDPISFFVSGMMETEDFSNEESEVERSGIELKNLSIRFDETVEMSKV